MLYGWLEHKYILSLHLKEMVKFLKYRCHCCLVAQSFPTLCDSMDCSPPGSSVHGILQARILEGVPSPGDLPNPGIEPEFPALQADSLHRATREDPEYRYVYLNIAIKIELPM